MTAPTSRTAVLPSIVLVPGYWLGAWVWDAVRDRLTALGHRTAAVTLPGLESADAARTRVTFDDHVAAVAEAVRMLPGPVVLVAHSGAGAVASAVADRMPAAFARIVYVDSGPVADGQVPRPDVAADVTEIPVPTFPEFGAMGVSDEGLDDAGRARFQRLAVPHPAGAVRDTVHLDDPARNRIPATVICCSIPSSAIRELVASGPSMFAPLNEIADLTLVDLPTGHWPMLSRADDLADLISSEARRA